MKLNAVPKLAKDAANTFTVEEHLGGRAGVGKGPATGCYTTSKEAIQAMAEALVRGNSATCIARDASGSGRLMRLALVPDKRSARAKAREVLS